MSVFINPFANQLSSVTDKHPMLFNKNHWYQVMDRYILISVLMAFIVCVSAVSLIVYLGFGSIIGDDVRFRWMALSVIVIISLLGTCILGICFTLTYEKRWANVTADLTLDQRKSLAKQLRDFHKQPEFSEYIAEISEENKKAILVKNKLINRPMEHAIGLMSDDFKLRERAVRYLLEETENSMLNDLEILVNDWEELTREEEHQALKTSLKKQVDAL